MARSSSERILPIAEESLQVERELLKSIHERRKVKALVFVDKKRDVRKLK